MISLTRSDCMKTMENIIVSNLSMTDQLTEREEIWNKDQSLRKEENGGKGGARAGEKIKEKRANEKEGWVRMILRKDKESERKMKRERKKKDGERIHDDQQFKG